MKVKKKIVILLTCGILFGNVLVANAESNIEDTTNINKSENVDQNLEDENELTVEDIDVSEEDPNSPNLKKNEDTRLERAQRQADSLPIKALKMRYILVDTDTVYFPEKIVKPDQEVVFSFKLEENKYIFDKESLAWFGVKMNGNSGTAYIPITYNPVNQTYTGRGTFGWYEWFIGDIDFELSTISLWSSDDHYTIYNDPNNEFIGNYDYNNIFQNLGEVFTCTVQSGGEKTSPVTNLKAIPAGKNTTRLIWNPSKNADGYLIYAKKNGKYGYCGMTTKSSTFTDTKALDKEYNFYWVFPYSETWSGKKICGPCTKYVFAKGICPSVTNLKPASQIGSVKLTWTASVGSEGYLVYGKTASGKYGYIGMTTKGTSYVDKKASKKEYNFYWVYPYHKDKSGKMIVGRTPKYVYGKAK
ncbi:hypothetical protein DWX43_19325 [Clostridium sp. AF19-22AC]|uniref:hypothetical protein n=1 Tax=Clostridia TaxID=186801 RepID=UPI000E4ED25A|nr:MULTISPECIES: hypothetical protein [Clostridia]RHR24794.1 hypothetical protein DWX43_19325 [Clostridium sp. AF19-22AC]